ncbi:MAG: multicopper oxidase family protein [Sulfitobacter sp.]
MMKLNRRAVLLGTGAIGVAALGGSLLGSGRPAQAATAINLTTRRTSFAFNGPTTQGVVSTVDNAPPPVLRLKQNVEAVLNFTNGLPDYTTMHWHGMRIPNAMDGVPYLTQFPIAEGETFEYRYTPPDAGTFWYHPHCMTGDQMAEGMTGLLIVDEAEDPGFDIDLPLNLKGFRLAKDGSFLPYYTARGAARGGTNPNVMTTNWEISPTYEVPAGGLARIRIGVTDITRVYKIVFPDVAGRIIAWDGHPIEEEVPWPTAEAPLILGPGQRVDVAIETPADAEVELVFNHIIGARSMPLATLRTAGPALGRTLAQLAPLPENPIAKPDIENAEVIEMVFGWSPSDQIPYNGFCGGLPFTFWSIDRSPWPGDAVDGTGPIATLEMGKDYILRMRNESPNDHPIHLHGLVFVPISSNKRKIPANYTDTVLLQKSETIEVALRADNPGDWAFHCHVIEHQKTGLAGFIRVV